MDLNKINVKKIKLALSNRNYEIWIGHQALDQMDRFIHHTFGKNLPSKIIVLADSRLKKVAGKLNRNLIPHGIDVRTFWIEASESLKDFDSIYPLYGKLLQAKADRNSMILALGGGVIGDVAGFIAGTYLRGIRWMGVPTTLLAQVDSAVGGKTGINHKNGKNLIGLFHQPAGVLCDTSLLRSLPKRELISGLGEVVKYALIFDPDFFSELQKKWKDLFNLNSSSRIPPRSRGSSFILSTWVETVERCLRWKALIVEKDEFEMQGVRTVLNFGHTFGHALEAVTRYKKFRHGEAVIWGMRVAVYLSAIRGYLSAPDCNKIDQFLTELPVPEIPRSIKTTEFINKMKWDKKNRNGKVTFVLLKKLGQTVLDSQVGQSELVQAIERVRK